MSIFERAIKMFGIHDYTLSFWSEPHPEGKLFYLQESDIRAVKENCLTADHKVPLNPNEIVEAATNGLGTLMRTEVNGAQIEFFVPAESLTFANTNLKVFAGLEESPKP